MHISPQEWDLLLQVPDAPLLRLLLASEQLLIQSSFFLHLVALLFHASHVFAPLDPQVS